MKKTKTDLLAIMFLLFIFTFGGCGGGDGGDDDGVADTNQPAQSDGTDSTDSTDPADSTDSAVTHAHSFGDLGMPETYEHTLMNYMATMPDSSSAAEGLPSSFDWQSDTSVSERRKSKRFRSVRAANAIVTPAKDQGSCGSCWAFAAAGALESKILMAGGPEYDLSEQQQVACNLDNLGCCGGLLSALKFWYYQGPMTESCQPYSEYNTQCACTGSAPCSSEYCLAGSLSGNCFGLPYRTEGYYTVNMNDINEVKLSLANDGPAPFAYNIYSDFIAGDGSGFWRDGTNGEVYTQSGGEFRGGHAVLLIGWDDAKHAWLLKNSWGQTGPNSDGTFWMAYSGHRNDLELRMANCALQPIGQPVADAGEDQNVAENLPVVLDGTNSTDPDHNITDYLWEQTGGPMVALMSASSSMATFTAPAVGASGETLVFRLTVTDSGGLSDTDTCIVNVIGENGPPIANAGAGQTAITEDIVMLDGSGSSDPDDGIQTYKWVQTGGSIVTISDHSAIQPSFVAPEVAASGETLVFELTVTDQSGIVSVHTCSVYVSTDNLPPVADAGEDVYVAEGETITLDASNSTDPDDGISTYSWEQTDGTPVTLSDASSAQPDFTAPDAGDSGETLVFQLTVTDVDGNRSADTCSVHVTAGNVTVNLPPMADAGEDLSVAEGETVTLDASNSTDPDDGISTYAWEQIGGVSVTLSDASSAQPAFTAPNAGLAGEILVFQLTATDSGGNTSVDICSVFVTAEEAASDNLPPVALAVDSFAAEGETVTLDASNSIDPDDGIATYSWEQTGGTTITLSDTSSAQPAFVAPAGGDSGETLVFQLTVTDFGGNTDTDTCSVFVMPDNVIPDDVTPDNFPPMAVAADQVVIGGETATLDGSNSADPEGDIAAYSWEQTGGTTVTLSDSSSAQPTFVAPDTGETLVFQLTVTDSGGNTATAECSVYVTAGNVMPDNLPPVAFAVDQYVAEGETVSLDGSNSTDPDDGISTYFWEQIGGPPVTLSDSSSAQPTFVAPDTGETLVFQLTVTDSGGNTATAECSVYVTAGNVMPDNLPPVAFAVDQYVAEGETVSLDGSNSTDPDDGISTYFWEQIGGPPVTLSDTSSAQPSFVAPVAGVFGETLVFQLTVTDSGGNVATDTCSVYVALK